MLLLQNAAELLLPHPNPLAPAGNSSGASRLFGCSDIAASMGVGLSSTTHCLHVAHTRAQVRNRCDAESTRVYHFELRVLPRLIFLLSAQRCCQAPTPHVACTLKRTFGRKFVIDATLRPPASTTSNCASCRDSFFFSLSAQRSCRYRDSVSAMNGPPVPLDVRGMLSG